MLMYTLSLQFPVKLKCWIVHLVFLLSSKSKHIAHVINQFQLHFKLKERNVTHHNFLSFEARRCHPFLSYIFLDTRHFFNSFWTMYERIVRTLITIWRTKANFFKVCRNWLSLWNLFYQQVFITQHPKLIMSRCISSHQKKTSIFNLSFYCFVRSYILLNWTTCIKGYCINILIISRE